MRKGETMSDAQKLVLSIANTGENHPNWGKPRSAKTRKRISQSQIGKVIPAEQRQRMSEAKQGDFYRGENNPFYGHKHSEESLAQMSAAKTGENHPNYGKPLSDDTKKLIGDSHRGANSVNFGKPLPAEQRAAISAAALRNPRRGAASARWKGGITPLMTLVRMGLKYRQWRSDVFTRDDFTCCSCGERGGHLEADHYPKTFASIFHANNITTMEEALACEELWNLNNGRTMCEICHDLSHTALGQPMMRVESYATV